MTETGESFASFGLCLAARKHVVDKQMGADPSLPGPGAYIDPLTEGRTANGEYKDVPSACFCLDGVKEHGRPIEKQLNSADRMGPKYQLDNITSGRQIQSRIRTAPSATFGSGPQRYHGGASFTQRTAEPSPQHYDTDKLTRGIFNLSTRQNVQGTKFMTGPRTYNDANARAAASMPAPGQYKPQSGIGKQVESKYRGGNFFTMGGGSRDFVKANAAKEPGPGHYIDPLKEGRTPSGEVKAILSYQKSYPSAVFGTSKQRPESSGLAGTEKRPGPNSYLVPGSVGKQINSRYKTCQASTFGAR